jgi:periplasmic protein TonB
MSAVTAYYRQFELPWTPGAESEERFRRILKQVLIAWLVLGVAMPFLPVPEPDLTQAPDVPDRVVQLILQQPKPVPPPPKVEPKLEQPKPEMKVPEPRAVVQPVVRPDPVVNRTERAREKAAQSGLLAMADELADLRDNSVADQIADARAVTGAVGAAVRAERSLITSRLGQGSGGINTASLSRNTGGSGLKGRSTTRVASAPLAGMAAADSPGRSDSRGARSREEIEMIFDQNKGAIFALYNRALRSNPALQGKLVLRLTIEGSGAVSACEIVSSDLKDDELERKLVARVKLFRFQSKDVPAVTTTKPIDFFPA